MRPPPLDYYHFGEVPGDLGTLHIADLIRCRKRALELSEHDLPPVLCTYDDVLERTEPVLGDITFVTRPAGCFRELLGYTGPGPQHRAQTVLLMEQGVIGWHDIFHTLAATGRPPHDILREPFKALEEAWGEDGLQKRCFNALMGIFCLDEAWRYSLNTSSFSVDAPTAASRRTFHFEGGHVTDHLGKQILRSIATHRPLHDMCTEARRIGQALALLRDAGSKVYEIKADSTLFGGHRCDLAGLQRHTGEPVFHQGPVEPRDLMKSTGKMPQRELAAPPDPLPHWTEMTEEEEARARVIAGGSLAVEGNAGCGRSTCVGSLVKELADGGKTMSAISKPDRRRDRGPLRAVEEFERLLHLGYPLDQ